MGSISTGILLCRWYGLPDPRSQGSKNPGATNVLRFGGKKIAFVTMVGDVLKGVIPVLIAKAFLTPGNPMLGWIAFAAFLGHVYPVYFKFQGGKGVATALGVVMALYWPLGLVVLGTWIFMAFFFRISSLASLTAAMVIPTVGWWLTPPYFWPYMMIMLLIFFRHHQNIARLIQGREPRIGQNK